MTRNKAAAWVAGLITPVAAVTFGDIAQSKTKNRPTTAPHSKAAAGRPRAHRTQTRSVTAPRDSVQTAGQMTSYLKSQGLGPVMAAGIVGNLQQESTLNPNAPGYGLAQWNASRWASASRWIRAHGQKPGSAAGQLMYIAANVTSNVDAGTFYRGLWKDLLRAHSPQQAALVWMNDYEQCSGAGSPGTTSYNANSLCMPGQRMVYAGRANRA